MVLDFTMNAATAGRHFAQLELIRGQGRAVYNEQLRGWMVVGYDDVRNCLSDTRNFTSEDTPIRDTFGPEAMLVKDGEIHNALRSVWAKQVSVKAVDTRRERLAALGFTWENPIRQEIIATLKLCRQNLVVAQGPG